MGVERVQNGVALVIRADATLLSPSNVLLCRRAWWLSVVPKSMVALGSAQLCRRAWLSVVHVRTYLRSSARRLDPFASVTRPVPQLCTGDSAGAKSQIAAVACVYVCRAELVCLARPLATYVHKCVCRVELVRLARPPAMGTYIACVCLQAFYAKPSASRLEA